MPPFSRSLQSYFQFATLVLLYMADSLTVLYILYRACSDIFLLVIDFLSVRCAALKQVPVQQEHTRRTSRPFQNMTSLQSLDLSSPLQSAKVNSIGKSKAAM